MINRMNATERRLLVELAEVRESRDKIACEYFKLARTLRDVREELQVEKSNSNVLAETLRELSLSGSTRAQRERSNSRAHRIQAEELAEALRDLLAYPDSKLAKFKAREEVRDYFPQGEVTPTPARSRELERDRLNELSRRMQAGHTPIR